MASPPDRTAPSVRASEGALREKLSSSEIALAELRAQMDSSEMHLRDAVKDAEARAARLSTEHASMCEELAAATAGRRIEREQLGEAACRGMVEDQRGRQLHCLAHSLLQPVAKLHGTQ